MANRFTRYEQSLLNEEYARMGLTSPIQGKLDIQRRVADRKGDLIDLSIMTDQKPPDVVRTAAAEQAQRGGYIKNGLNAREKVCGFYCKERGVRFDPQTEIFMTAGGQTAMDNAFKLLVEPGDEVILAEPEYATYEPMVRFYGGEARSFPLVMHDDGWRPDLDALARLFSPRTKLVALSSPNNPTGHVFQREELGRIVECVEQAGCWLISDETWASLVVDPAVKFLSAGLFSQVRDKTIIIYSASKTFGMSGYRIGAVMGPADFIDAFDAVSRYSFHSAPTIGQVALTRALDLDETRGWIEARIAGLKRRIDESTARLRGIPGIRCAAPESGVFLFPDVGACDMSSLEFVLALIEEKGVCVFPGYFYGRHCDRFVRISMSSSDESYRTGMDRLVEFLMEECR